MDINVIISFQALPERINDFTELLDEVRRELPKVPGCLGARVFRHEDQPGGFTLFETWASRAQHAAHIEQVVASGRWAHVLSHLAENPVSHYCSEA